MKTIIFDKENPSWNDDEQYNLLFIQFAERHLTDLLEARGYVYDNEIYELFDAKWNPKDENQVHLYDDEFTYRHIVGWFECTCKEDGSIIIDIIDLKKES